MNNINILFQNNDTVLELENLKNEVNGAYLNSATVTVTLKDSAGMNVTGTTWPKAMTYVAASNGMYRATLPYGLALVPAQRYTATIVADAGAGLHAEWSVECVCRARN